MKGLIDTTLREGAQTAGVSFSKGEKKAIIDALIDIGIEEIEAGIVSDYDRELSEITAHCRKSSSKTKVSLWCLCRKEDIRLAAGLAPDILSLSVPVSDIHLQQKLHKSRTWVEDILIEAVMFAKELGFKEISLGLEDATRADLDFVVTIGRAAADLGVFRLRLADTVGVASPLQIQSLVQEVKKIGPEVAIHCHNDFGMATANCITALESGADWADITILGLGERTGTARLEEVAAYLFLQNGRSYQIGAIPSLSRKVALITKQEIPASLPIIGQNIFTCETGLHLQGLEQAPQTYEPYPPELVGARRRLLYGDKVGRRGRFFPGHEVTA